MGCGGAAEETKRFSLRVVLTVTTCRLLTRPRGPKNNGIRDLGEILGWMTNDQPFTHQLPRFGSECKPWLLRWFPELEKAEDLIPELDANLEGAHQWSVTEGIIKAWLITVRQNCKCRAFYEVPRIPRDDHDRINPYDELVIEKGTDEGIILVTETSPDA